MITATILSLASLVALSCAWAAMRLSDEELAQELAEKNGECGAVSGDLICTRPKGHEDGHRGMPIRKVIPIN